MLFRSRFKRELERLKPYDYSAIIIEASHREVASPYSFSRVHPSSILGSLQSMQLQYGIDVIFAGDRSNAVDIMVAKIGAFYAQA